MVLPMVAARSGAAHGTNMMDTDVCRRVLADGTLALPKYGSSNAQSARVQCVCVCVCVCACLGKDVDIRRDSIRLG
jgi:hypothetical protein